MESEAYTIAISIDTPKNVYHQNFSAEIERFVNTLLPSKLKYCIILTAASNVIVLLYIAATEILKEHLVLRDRPRIFIENKSRKICFSILPTGISDNIAGKIKNLIFINRASN